MKRVELEEVLEAEERLNEQGNTSVRQQWDFEQQHTRSRSFVGFWWFDSAKEGASSSSDTGTLNATSSHGRGAQDRQAAGHGQHQPHVRRADPGARVRGRQPGVHALQAARRQPARLPRAGREGHGRRAQDAARGGGQLRRDLLGVQEGAQEELAPDRRDAEGAGRAGAVLATVQGLQPGGGGAATYTFAKFKWC
ncbi:hypothetical protein ON010_g14149 [Phytophthora cinnamomi]|nr:hypothetical protein ON010_g14149 [Phytophthora cinnamomi]